MTSTDTKREIKRSSLEFDFKEGWFTEVVYIREDIATSVLVKKILHEERSKYQDILLFESSAFGKVLVLDGVMQLTEKDEFAYQEMISFLPLNSHPNPKNVLIIGGGDGGVVREVSKHPSVEAITLCEIDERVIELTKKYLPFMAKGFTSPKLTLYMGDGAEYLKEHKAEFDVVITDSPDPVGPAVSLFQKPYYESVKESLKPGGVIASQGEGFWFDVDIVKDLLKMAKTVFPVVDYSISYVGSYTGGHLGYLLCGTSLATNFRKPIHKFSLAELDKMGLRYYSTDVHRASFALPMFLAQALDLSWEI